VTFKKRVLLVNPTMTSRRSARFPLSILSIAAALDDKYEFRLIDGNMDRDYLSSVRRTLSEDDYFAVGVTVMGGPQVRSGIEVSRIVRQQVAHLPIAWGGYFPTLYPAAAINAPYVDYAIRGMGEATFGELLPAIADGAKTADVANIAGLTWKHHGCPVHNVDRPFADRRSPSLLPYDLLGDPRAYLARTFIGRRTVIHQAAAGCRFRCTFCGVAAMFRGATALPPALKLQRDLAWLRQLGADSIQYVDHNFFDREQDMLPLLEVMAEAQLPWWCYARADALLNLSPATWALVRKSRMRMAYIGAESPSDVMLKDIRKGTKADQTLAVAELCRRQGVIPELSFMVAPPHDPEGETERTFEFIRQVKQINPQSEIIVYIYTPLPASSLPANSRARNAAVTLREADGSPLHFPTNPEQWTAKRWVDYACHADAPWVSDPLRRRIKNFVTVLGCRFPTVQDVHSAPWSKRALQMMASWRYHYRRYDRPWELAVSRKLIRLADPRVTSI
jgi:anaerobic magnesium-protoporphyrin IX monomethyl ester cyclase